MKRIYTIALMIFAAVCCLSSCAEVEALKEPGIVEGEPAKVTLKFNVNHSEEISTRAAQSTYYEYLVQNVYVFLFNGDKRVEVSKSFFEAGDITDYINKEDSDGNEESSGQIQFDAVSGANMKICIVANIGTSNSVLTKAEVSGSEDSGTEGSGNTVTEEDIAKMDAITSYKELQALSVSLDANTVFRGASFLMTGEEAVSLQAQEDTEVTVELSRADSKITFNVSAAATNANYKDMKFIPGKWRVVNVPTRTWVLPPAVTAGETLTADLDAATAEDDFFEVSASAAPQFEGAVSGTANSGTFTFYMYENLKAPKAEAASYALREKQTKNEAADNVVTGQRYVNGDYVYAPEYATYVVFNGELSYTDNTTAGSPKYVIADVEYCVHLGHASETNFNDYSTLRNRHYTYNVSITGVSDITVEVDSNDGTDDNEQRPGAEGDVVESATEIINVDGHYDRGLITLTAEEAATLYFAVSTPYERGLDANGFATSETLRDYKWVKFLINSEAGVADDVYAAYPGEQCYDGGTTQTGTAVNSPVYDKNITLRDVRQLSTYLHTNPPTGNTVITAFIDEYLYFHDPLNEEYKGVTSTNADLTLWKKSVNQNDRMLHIVKAGDMKYSADGESSVSRSVVTIKQRPILTFYNVNATGLTSAWGTETINETPKMTVSRTSYPSQGSNNDYAYSQILTANNGNNSWESVISSSEQYGLLTGYVDPSYACALRNRDLDGDGKIDNNEIQWYLASLDQMSDLWIGEPCMPEYAWLYNPDEPDGYYTNSNKEYAATHYATSAISNNIEPIIYWAEEYGANSKLSEAIDWDQAPLENNEAILSLRCVRNLGISYTSTDLPQTYIIISGGTPDLNNSTVEIETEYQLDFEYINPNALRTWNDKGNALPVDTLNTQTENNRPYGSLFVLPDSYALQDDDGWYTWYDFYFSEKYNTNRACPDGYRVPNQREMLLMTSVLDGWNTTHTYYTSLNHQIVHDRNNQITKFGSFYYKSDSDHFFRDAPKEISGIIDTDTEDYENYLSNNSSTYTIVVRCVKDNLSYTPQSAASTYENGGSIYQ